MSSSRHALALATLVSLTLALPAVAGAAEPASGSSDGTPCRDANIVPSKDNVARVRAATLCLLNVERKSRGLAPLHSSANLRNAATNWSSAMVRKRFFGHTSPAGSTMLSRVMRTSYINRSVRDWAIGENLGWGCGTLATPQSMVEMWMNSSGHRGNILNARFRHVGIGVATGAPAKFDGTHAATYTTDFGYRIQT